jgi:hypothetical protein
MKLVPFFLKESTKHLFHIQTLTVFLAHAGKALWTTDESGVVSKEKILSDYCEANGFVVKEINIEKDIAFLEIDPRATNISDFYSWEEALTTPGRPECWRRFHFIQDKEGGDWWSPKGLIEAELQGFGNVESLFRHLRTLC